MTPIDHTHWQQVIGDDTRFARRIAWGNPPQIIADTDWQDFLQRVIAAEKRAIIPPPGEPIPFQDLLLPFLIAAQTPPLDPLPMHGEGGGGGVSNQLEHALLMRLARIAAPTLLVELQKLNSYPALIERGLAPILEKYPVLGRLLSTVTVFWIEIVQELQARLAADQVELAALFGAAGQVIDIQTSLSDPHARGRAVFILTFENQQKMVYKPRSLGLEAAFHDLLRHLNTQGFDFKTLRVLDRGAYGWMECVPHQPCADTAAVERYYARAGMLLALIHSLWGNDCHQENLIACGEYPVLIDCETLLHHRVPDIDYLGENAPALAHTLIETSVLRTEMLPYWDTIDKGGLGGGLAAMQFAPRWRDLNTDTMRLETQFIPAPTCPNLPYIGEKVCPVVDYTEQVIDGFCRMYRFLMRHPLPMEALQNQPARFVFRPTQVYGSFLKYLVQPRFLRDEAIWLAEMDQMSRVLLWYTEKPLLWDVIAMEQAALQNLDIPRLIHDTSRRDLTDGHRTIGGCFAESGYELAVKRLQNLSEADMARQVKMMRLAFACYTAKPETRTAAEIVTFLQENAIRAADGSATWIAAIPQERHYKPGQLSEAWLCGAALLLAQHGDPDLAGAALKAVRVGHERFKAAATPAVQYALYHLGKFFPVLAQGAAPANHDQAIEAVFPGLFQIFG